MALQSVAFRGDALLEAAATSDSGHIVPGGRGPHVAKIQRALNQLEGLSLSTDGAYGPDTAAAVLFFKSKRGIVNRRYQTTPDNIVGIMTMAALDQEMLAVEATLGRTATFVPALLWRPIRGPRTGAS